MMLAVLSRREWRCVAGAGARRALLCLCLLSAGAAQSQSFPLLDGARPVPAEWLGCSVCHGTDLMGNAALAAPRLAGRPAGYVREQLMAFRSGRRGTHPADVNGALMRPQAMYLDDAAIARAAAYVAALSPRAAAIDDDSDNKETSMKKTPANSLGRAAGAAALAITLGAGSGASAEVRRHALPGSDFPIAQAVEVLPGTTLVYHSGMTPRPANPDAEQYSADYWGDTEAQTLSVFGRLEESLTAKGLTFGDVIKMQVFLVAPEAGGTMDFAGMMRAYRRYFGTGDQPNLPARSALQVAGLAVPGMLVEIEVVLARP